MHKKTRDSELTKAKIIQNAMKLFSKKGYDATTADDVAKACDINKAMIFYYYKNKAGLYGAVMSEALSSIHEEITKQERVSTSPIVDLEVFIKTYALYCQKHSYLPALLLRELSDSGAHLPEMTFSSMRKLFALLSKILMDGEKEKIFSNIEPMVIYFMIVGTLNLFITTQALREKATQIQDNLNTCSDCAMDDIAEYIFKKIKLMLEVPDETNNTCS